MQVIRHMTTSPRKPSAGRCHFWYKVERLTCTGGLMSREAFVGNFLAGVLLFGGTIAAWADNVSDGDAAFHNGDYANARKMLMPLAQKGNAVAQRDIGTMYFAGNGFTRDSREAVKWFLMSARQGQIGAQVNLGIAYVTGDGVQRNLIQAYVWFAAAASQRPGKTVGAKYRDHIATELPPDQLQKAQVMAARCQATNYGDCSGE